MAKITDLTNYTSQASTDVLPIVDVTNNTTKKITLGQLFTTPFFPDATITEAKLAFTPFFQLLGSTTLSGTADTITVSSFAGKKYLRILVWTVPSGATNTSIRFNNDSGSNYARRFSNGGAADTTEVSQTSVTLQSDSNTTPKLTVIDMVNVSTVEKILNFFSSGSGTTGAANAPSRTEGSAKWANTANAVTRVDVINGAAGDFAAGSAVIVLGHD